MKFSECDNDRPLSDSERSTIPGACERKVRETRDEVLRRSARPPRTSDAEIRRLYEPAPTQELRGAMTDAVKEVFITECCRRLDAIAEIARELGGVVGAQIRALASADGLPNEAPALVSLHLATPAAHVVLAPDAMETTNEREPLGDFLRVGDVGAALPETYCRRCPGTPMLMTWIRGTGYRCASCDDPSTRRTVLREVTVKGELLDSPTGLPTGKTS